MNKIKYIKIPTICPYCNSELKIIQNNETKTLNCINNNCPEKLLNKLNHFCSKDKGMDIKGLSKATLEKLIDWGWINEISDIYKLDRYSKEWIRKPGFGIKSVENILNAIEESKECELWQFISALGIPLIGSAVAKDLANNFKTYDDFANAIKNNFNFEKLPNFGYTMNKSIYNYDWSIADKLVDCGLIIKDTSSSELKEETLKGMTIVITGKLQEYKRRDDLKAEIEALGGKVSSSISSKTDYLINNDINSTTGKNKAAKEKGVAIISEKEFIKKFLKK